MAALMYQAGDSVDELHNHDEGDSPPFDAIAILIDSRSRYGRVPGRRIVWLFSSFTQRLLSMNSPLVTMETEVTVDVNEFLLCSYV